MKRMGIKNFHLFRSLVFSFSISLVFFSCASIHQKPGPVSVDDVSVLSEELLSVNYVVDRGFTLSLPPGWQFYRYNSSDGDGPQLLFYKNGYPTEVVIRNGVETIIARESERKFQMTGKYEKVEFSDNGIKNAEVLYAYKEKMYGSWVNQKYQAAEILDKDFHIFTAQKRIENELYTRISCITFSDNSMHILEFSGPAQGLARTTIMNFVTNSFTTAAAPQRSSRINREGYSFLKNSSTFTWYSDMKDGLSLSGSIDGYPAVIIIRQGDKKNEKSKSIHTIRTFMDAKNVEIHTVSSLNNKGDCVIEGFLSPVFGNEETVSQLQIYIRTNGKKLEPNAVLQNPEIKKLLWRELFFVSNR